MIDVSGRRRRRRLVLALVGSLAAVASGLVGRGGPRVRTPHPVAIVVDSITGQTSPSSVTCRRGPRR